MTKIIQTIVILISRILIESFTRFLFLTNSLIKQFFLDPIILLSSKNKKKAHYLAIFLTFIFGKIF